MGHTNQSLNISIGDYKQLREESFDGEHLLATIIITFSSENQTFWA